MLLNGHGFQATCLEQLDASWQRGTFNCKFAVTFKDLERVLKCIHCCILTPFHCVSDRCQMVTRQLEALQKRLDAAMKRLAEALCQLS